MPDDATLADIASRARTLATDTPGLSTVDTFSLAARVEGLARWAATEQERRTAQTVAQRLTEQRQREVAALTGEIERLQVLEASLRVLASPSTFCIVNHDPERAYHVGYSALHHAWRVTERHTFTGKEIREVGRGDTLAEALVLLAGRLPGRPVEMARGA